MNLHARISKIEAAAPPVRTLEIIATDRDDLFEKVLLSGIGPGHVRVIGLVAGEPIDETRELLTHEEYLELLN